MSIEHALTINSPVDEDTSYEASYDAKKQIEKWVKSVIIDTDDLLPNTAFNVAANVSQYIELNNRGNREGYKSLTKCDIVGHTTEFSLGQPVIPYEISLQYVQNAPQIFTKDYVTGVEVPMLSILNPKERDGSVVRRTQLLAKLIDTASEGDVFVATSPGGWHGLASDDGVPYTEYNHSQTAFIKVCEGKKLQAYTVRSSMTLDENEQFLERISHSKYSTSAIDVKQKIIDVSDTIVMAPDVKTLPEMVNLIQQIRGKDVFWRNTKYTGEHVKDWNFSEITTMLPHIHEVSDMDNVISPVIDSFWKKVETNIHGDSVDEIRLLTHFVHDAVLEASYVSRMKYTNKTETYNAQKETVHNQGQAGCVSYETEFGKRGLSLVEYSFDKWGLCRSGHKCATPFSETWLGPCDICEICDHKIQTGSLVLDGTEYKKIDVNISQEKTVSEAFDSGSLVISGFAILLSAIFSKN